MLSTSLEIVCTILNHQKWHGMVPMVSLLEKALSVEMAFPVWIHKRGIVKCDGWFVSSQQSFEKYFLFLTPVAN